MRGDFVLSDPTWIHSGEQSGYRRTLKVLLEVLCVLGVRWSIRIDQSTTYAIAGELDRWARHDLVGCSAKNDSEECDSAPFIASNGIGLRFLNKCRRIVGVNSMMSREARRVVVIPWRCLPQPSSANEDRESSRYRSWYFDNWPSAAETS
ncbi:MAG: hypothetical protein D6690_15280 [Nitrospirae bacterium]|nr:MAG: hypothetical protein D6690_15280 [Nitrospirota bacterium]